MGIYERGIDNEGVCNFECCEVGIEGVADEYTSRTKKFNKFGLYVLQGGCDRRNHGFGDARVPKSLAWYYISGRKTYWVT